MNTHSLLKALYRVALLLRELKREPGEITSTLLLYIEGVMRVLQREYFRSNSEVIIKNLSDAFSDGQMKSKLWLIEALKESNLSSLGCVFFCAGWYGSLAFFLLTDRWFSLNRCLLFEKDPLSVRVSEDLNRCFVKTDWKFKAVLRDIQDLDYSVARFQTLRADGTAQEIRAVPDTIINTACEHIENFDSWWSLLPDGKLIILQNNDYFGLPEHINCVSSLEEFKKQAPMDILYEGALNLGDYRRFLLIGRKTG